MRNIIIFLLTLSTVSGYSQADFIATFKTDNPGNSSNTSITIPCISASGYQVDFNNDGDLSDAGESTIHNTGFTHDFGAVGTYTIRIVGNLDQILFENDSANDPEKILSVDQWGTASVWTTMTDAFFGCTNITVPATDAPDLSICTNLNRMFKHASSFNDPVDHWDVSNIELMTDLFRGASNFNQAVNSWDVSKVRWADFLFSDATNFNQPLDNWDVTSMIITSNMFRYASSFNQPLQSWDVSAIPHMGGMFRGATSFNQPLNGWNVSGTTNMGSMFRGATSFNQPLNGWNVSNVTNMGSMFLDATSFDQPIDSWNVSNVTNLNSMFRNATSFNQPLNSWNVSNVTNMSVMFRNASNFDQPLHSWNVSNVTNMSNMFFDATNFNQPLDSWNVSNVTNMSAMFRNTPSFNQPLNSWIVTSVTNMSSMFRNSSGFNQPLNSWVVSSVTNMSAMFRDASNFNHPLDSWDISSVTNMSDMLNNAGLDCINYDATLIAWELLGVSGLTLGAEDLHYDSGLDARTSLTTTYGWTINGDIHTLGCSVLPVELLSFEASLKDDMVHLEWQTASEVNNKGFNIEHSTDADKWQSIGFKIGQGTSFKVNHYQFLHQNTVPGIHYYRLKQIDYDGFIRYSDVETVDRSTDLHTQIRLFPNPSGVGEVTLSFLDPDFESANLSIFDPFGRLVSSQKLVHANTQIRTDHFSKGIYFLSLERKGQRFLKKLIIQ